MVAGHPTLGMIGKALLAAHQVLLRELNGFEKRVRQQARQDKRVRLIMTAPGVGPIVGLTFVAAIDDPARFKSSKQVGPHFGLTPKKYQSGETDYNGRISKIDDASVRTALYEAANVILTRPLKGAIPRFIGKTKKRVAGWPVMDSSKGHDSTRLSFARGPRRPDRSGA